MTEFEPTQTADIAAEVLIATDAGDVGFDADDLGDVAAVADTSAVDVATEVGTDTLAEVDADVIGELQDAQTDLEEVDAGMDTLGEDVDGADSGPTCQGNCNDCVEGARCYFNTPDGVAVCDKGADCVVRCTEPGCKLARCLDDSTCLLFCAPGDTTCDWKDCEGVATTCADGAKACNRECATDDDGDGSLEGTGLSPCQTNQQLGCEDNCLGLTNADQTDSDMNGVGDACQ